MAWRVLDAARAFDSLSHPTLSRVRGPTEPPEPVVSRGASVLLGASASEPLSVAVARMVFRRMLAPGLIVTSARYVMRCAGVPAEPYLGSLASCHLLPATDHLSSLPRLLATVAAHYGDSAHGSAGLTDDLLFRLVRLAFLAYNYKSIGYRQGREEAWGSVTNAKDLESLCVLLWRRGPSSPVHYGAEPRGGVRGAVAGCESEKQLQLSCASAGRTLPLELRSLFISSIISNCYKSYIRLLHP